MCCEIASLGISLFFIYFMYLTMNHARAEATRLKCILYGCSAAPRCVLSLGQILGCENGISDIILAHFQNHIQFIIFPCAFRLYFESQSVHGSGNSSKAKQPLIQFLSPRPPSLSDWLTENKYNMPIPRLINVYIDGR